MNWTEVAGVVKLITLLGILVWMLFFAARLWAGRDE